MTTAQRKKIDHWTDLILGAMPESDMETHAEEQITILKESVAVLADLHTETLTVNGGIKKLEKLADRAIAFDAQEAGEVSG
jgi:hypothetical protein